MVQSRATRLAWTCARPGLTHPSALVLVFCHLGQGSFTRIGAEETRFPNRRALWLTRRQLELLCAPRSRHADVNACCRVSEASWAGSRATMSAAGSQKGDFLSENPLVSAQATDSKAAPPQHRQERSRNEPGLHGSMSIAATAAAAMMATHHRLKSSKRNSMLTGVCCPRLCLAHGRSPSRESPVPR